MAQVERWFFLVLKIREDRACNDKQFNKALIDVVRSRIRSVVQRETVDRWLSEVKLIFAYVKNALEGTIEKKKNQCAAFFTKHNNLFRIQLVCFGCFSSLWKIDVLLLPVYFTL
ncbi:unnamed protein product [Urochloa humidicola]